jgi:hypothetical protein
MSAKVTAIFLFSMAYAITRYYVFGPVAGENIPLFLMNKAVSMGSVLALTLAAYSHFKENPAQSRFWGKITLHSAFIHIVMSFPILDREYYAVFYGFSETGRMDRVGELVMLFGVLGAYFYWLTARSEPGSAAMRRFKIWSCVFVGAHIFELGAGGWLNVAGWYGSMPPITLITATAAAIALAFYILRPAKKK